MDENLPKDENDEEESSKELPKELGVSKLEDFSVWYNRIIQLADLIEKRYNVAGMFVWKPYASKLSPRLIQPAQRLY